MSHPRKPSPCKLFFTVIFPRMVNPESLRRDLVGVTRREVESTSPLFPFDVTDYYAREMGHDLVRIFYVMKGTFERDCLVEAKKNAYSLERKYQDGEGRRVFNIDPGLVTLENVVLSTFKNYYHRIYLGEGVYAEVTLAYIKGEMREFEWTYPDYRRDEMKEFLLSVREGLYQEIRGRKR
ncbi:MAG: DUF4416 family protein [Deltaproteobacteria bacterium]|nr:MAG: DUF4416 family protein [Deltaproteobacteria bacterium]